jgi:hypothetical protein
MISSVSRRLSKRREANRIDAALAAMSLKVFAQQGLPNLQDLGASNEYASGADLRTCV